MSRVDGRRVHRLLTLDAIKDDGRTHRQPAMVFKKLAERPITKKSSRPKAAHANTLSTLTSSRLPACAIHRSRT